MLIGGDIGSGTEDILIQGSALLTLSHSRGAEHEADHFSVDLMHRAGHDPAAIARFFELIRDRFGDTGESDFLSTHPATPERIAETRRYAEEVAAGVP
jgi:predicted Zn-dependent protease